MQGAANSVSAAGVFVLRSGEASKQVNGRSAVFSFSESVLLQSPQPKVPFVALFLVGGSGTEAVRELEPPAVRKLPCWLTEVLLMEQPEPISF